MCFKTSRALFLGLGILGVLSLTACDRFLKSSATPQQRAEKQTISVKISNVQCLSQFPEQLNNFITDRSSSEEVEQAFSCLNLALDTFEKYTQGEQPDRYTGEELRYFLNRYLLKDNQISAEYMAELMKIKLLAIGGSEQILTRSELKHVQKFLGVIKSEAEKLRGSMKILLFKAQPGATHDTQIEEAALKVKASALKILSEAKVAGSLYEFDDFRSFLSETQKFLNNTESLSDFLKWVPVAQALKNLFFGENVRLGSLRDWQHATNYALDGYTLGLKYFYHLQGKSFRLQADWWNLLKFFDSALDLVERAPVLLNDGRLEATGIDQVLDEVLKINLIKTELEPELLKKTYRVAIVRFLERNHSRQARVFEVQGIERKHLSVLRFEYNVWRLAQEMILEVFRGKNPEEGVRGAELKEALASQRVEERIKRLKGGEAERDQILRTWAEWRELLSLARPLQWNSSLKLNMRYDVAVVKTSLVGLNVQNLLRTASRFVLAAYGTGGDTDIWKLKIPEQGLVHLEEDFKDIGTALRFLDYRTEGAAKRTHKEANFFTYHANGDAWLDSRELIEELSLMISGAASMTNQMIELGVKNHCSTGQLDIFEKPIMSEECVSRVLRANFDRISEGMPWMASEVKMMTPEQWKTFFDSLMSVAYIDQHVVGQLEFSEIRIALMVLQYVEVLMMTYDGDRNGRLNEAEVTSALPRFKDFIASVSPMGQWMVDDIFLCMVFKGVKPTAGDLFSFKFSKSAGLGDVGRLELVKVLAVLKKDASR